MWQNDINRNPLRGTSLEKEYPLATKRDALRAIFRFEVIMADFDSLFMS